MVRFIPAWILWILHFPIVQVELIHTNTKTDHQVAGFVFIIHINRHGRRFSWTISPFIKFIAVIIVANLSTPVIKSQFFRHISIATTCGCIPRNFTQGYHTVDIFHGTCAKVISTIGIVLHIKPGTDLVITTLPGKPGIDTQCTAIVLAPARGYISRSGKRKQGNIIAGRIGVSSFKIIIFSTFSCNRGRIMPCQGITKTTWFAKQTIVPFVGTVQSAHTY